MYRLISNVRENDNSISHTYSEWWLGIVPTHTNPREIGVDFQFGARTQEPLLQSFWVRAGNWFRSRARCREGGREN